MGTIFVPVSDQERALAFYVGLLGFEKRVDFVYGAERIRWIEVAPRRRVELDLARAARRGRGLAR